jgi:hypothetical protein
MQTVETSIRITTLDNRQGENEETATAHHGPTGRAVGLVAICRGKRDSALQHWREREVTTQLTLNLCQDMRLFRFPWPEPPTSS